MNAIFLSSYFSRSLCWSFRFEQEENSVFCCFSVSNRRLMRQEIIDRTRSCDRIIIHITCTICVRMQTIRKSLIESYQKMPHTKYYEVNKSWNSVPFCPTSKTQKYQSLCCFPDPQYLSIFDEPSIELYQYIIVYLPALVWLYSSLSVSTCVALDKNDMHSTSTLSRI